MMLLQRPRKFCLGGVQLGDMPSRGLRTAKVVEGDVALTRRFSNSTLDNADVPLQTVFKATEHPYLYAATVTDSGYLRLLPLTHPMPALWVCRQANPGA